MSVITAWTLFIVGLHCTYHTFAKGLFSDDLDLLSTNQVDGRKEIWNYTNVRKDAYMFWWLYYADKPQDKPLVLWLQGGPGGSGTGYGNFMEIGPLDVNLNSRNTTWLNKVNLLFIDNPVGTGFSYVTNDNAYANDIQTIASDLLTVMKVFLKEVPEMQEQSFYIFSESYGGKMTAAFSKVLFKAIHNGELKCNFKGFAMGDSWISPADSVVSWAYYLKATSLIDGNEFLMINNAANKALDFINNKQWTNATQQFTNTQTIIEAATSNVNFYNILKWNGAARKNLRDELWYRMLTPYHNDQLSDLMNGFVREKLGIIPKDVKWGFKSSKVFQHQEGEFMKPQIADVDWALQNTDLSVVVYSGQLDLIVNSIGTETWLQKLKWSHLKDFNTSTRKTIVSSASGLPEAFVKTYKNLSFYWILNAGHMVPEDAANAALTMLAMVTNT